MLSDKRNYFIGSSSASMDTRAMRPAPVERSKVMPEIVLNNPNQVSAIIAPMIEKK